MAKRLWMLLRIFVLIGMLTMLLIPVSTFATRTPGAYFGGSVYLNGNSLNETDSGAVTAFIAGVTGEWTVPIMTGHNGTGPTISQYSLLIVPPNTASGSPRNGGVEGDIVQFKVTINGDLFIDTSTAVWHQGVDIPHSIYLTNSQISNLIITTNTLASGNVGTSYSQNVTATGGQTPYSWSWAPTAPAVITPPGLTLASDTGIISGIPTTPGTYRVTITVTDHINVMYSKSFNLIINTPLSAITITNNELARWPAEIFPAVIPEDWVIPPPGWIKNVAYLNPSTNLPIILNAVGGMAPYHWSATGFPHGLALSQNGTIVSGNGTIPGIPDIMSPISPGFDTIVVTVTDSAVPANSTSKIFLLKIYLQGDSNGDGVVLDNDVVHAEKVLLGLQPATAGTDADEDKMITIADITKIERLRFGLTGIQQ